MRYTGQFRNINNTLYQVDLVTTGSGSTEIMFSDTPFKVEYNNENTIYSPLKLSNATASIISNSYIFDLYSSGAQDVKCTLTNLDSGLVEWVGFVTPNVYTQGFENEFEKIDVECIDGLSTLENYIYETIDSSQAKIKSFEDLIVHIVAKCNCYSNIYINGNSYISGSTDSNLINQLYVSEYAFCDEDKTESYLNTVTNRITTKTSSSNLTYKEVLSNLLQYLNYTIIPWGDSLYMLSWDYIKNGFSDYVKYSTTDNWSSYTKSNVTLSDNHNITENSFRSNGATIELDNTYNCCSIKSSLKKRDELLPGFFEDDLLTNIYDIWSSYYVYLGHSTDYQFKFFTHKDYTYKWYNNDTSWTAITPNKDTIYNQLCNNIGSMIVGVCAYQHSSGIPTNPTYENCIVLFRHLQSNPSTSQNVLKPVLQLNEDSLPETSYLFDDYGIIISGSALWDDREGTCAYDSSLTSRTGDTFTEDQLVLYAQLRIGDKYWNGTSWTTTNSNFKLQFSKGSEDHLYYKWFDIKNTINVSRTSIRGAGQLIPINKNDYLVGDVEFVLYSPINILPNYRVDSVWLKNLSLKIVTPTTNKSTDTDTLYKNVINDAFVNEFSGLDFKVSTQTDKGISYSSVIQKPTGTSSYSYCYSLFDKSLNKAQMQEFNIIESYVNQHSTPQRQLNVTLENIYKPYTLFTCALFPSDHYIINKMSIDYQQDNNLLTITNKV